MIYVIMNYSRMIGDSINGGTIQFVTTDKKIAEAYFKGYCTEFPKNNKWHYEYELLEFPNNYDAFSTDAPNIIMDSESIDDLNK